MSEISEKKALEAYPVIPSPYYGGDEDRNLKYRFGFVKGYDQAMQDFLEKNEKWFNDVFIDDAHDSERGFFTKIVTYDFDNIQELIEQFKNYMQDEM